MLGRFDFFYRAERGAASLTKAGLSFDAYWEAKGAYQMALDLPEDIELGDAIEAAKAAGMPKGSMRSGCFEIQTPTGIWSHINERRIDVAKPNKIVFQPWE